MLHGPGVVRRCGVPRACRVPQAAPRTAMPVRAARTHLRRKDPAAMSTIEQFATVLDG